MIQTDYVLDAKGLACPMPIVKTRKAMNELNPGAVMEIQATDKGSTADLKAWAERTGHQYLGTTEDGEVLKHYVRKSGEELPETTYEHVVTNEQLQQLLESRSDVVVLDVRETAEYAFGHIPGARSLPLGQLEDGLSELDQDAEIYVICRTGTRSDLACRKLVDAGFEHVKNVMPGMSEWTGETEYTTGGILK